MDTNRNFFTDEQVIILRSNPYTAGVNNRIIHFTVEFKKFILAEKAKKQYTYNEILIHAGYDPKMLGEARVQHIFQKAAKEAMSEKGLREVKKRQSVLDKDAEKARMQTMIKGLQEEVEYLKQEIEVLKKIQFLKQTKK